MLLAGDWHEHVEGLEPRFRAGDIYPAYSPGGVQAMHSGRWVGEGGGGAGWTSSRVGQGKVCNG